MRTDWRQHAACRDVALEVFHPPEKTSMDEPRRICHQCPVRAACLAEAIELRDTFGFRAGMTGEERRKLLRRPEKDLATEVEVVRLSGLRWSPKAIGVRCGIDSTSVYAILKEHRKQAAA